MAKPIKKLVNFHADPPDIVRWKASAHAERKSFSQWLREACDDAAERVEPRPIPPAPVVPPVMDKAVRELPQQLLERASILNTSCLKRIPKGSYCKSCDRIHA